MPELSPNAVACAEGAELAEATSDGVVKLKEGAVNHPPTIWDLPGKYWTTARACDG